MRISSAARLRSRDRPPAQVGMTHDRGKAALQRQAASAGPPPARRQHLKHVSCDHPIGDSHVTDLVVAYLASRCDGGRHACPAGRLGIRIRRSEQVKRDDRRAHERGLGGAITQYVALACVRGDAVLLNMRDRKNQKGGMET